MNYGNLHRYSDNAVLRRASEDELVESLQAMEEGNDCIFSDALVGMFLVEGESCFVSGFSEEALNAAGFPDHWKLVQANGVVVGFNIEEEGGEEAEDALTLLEELLSITQDIKDSLSVQDRDKGGGFEERGITPTVV